MKRIKTSSTLWIATLTMVVTAGCEQGTVSPDAPRPDPKVQITTDETVLAARVTDFPDVELSIESLGPSGDGVAFSRSTKETTLKLVSKAHVLPPSVDGVSLQASHIVIRDKHAFVSYMLAGSDYLGAVDVFSTGGRPKLKSHGLLRNADVTAVAATDDAVYLAIATNDLAYLSPAGLIELELKKDKLKDGLRWADLPSYVATSVVEYEGSMLVTTGSSDDGGLFQVDMDDLSVSPVENFRQARSVAVADPVVVAMSGVPGALHVYDDESLNPRSTWSVGGAMNPDAKSVVAISEGHAFVAAGAEGLRIVRLRDGVVVAEIPMAEMTDEVNADAVTNGVAVDDELVFIANGGAGLYVIRVDDLDENTPDIEHIGRVVFPGNDSINQVAVRKDKIFAASGNGGLQVVEIKHR